MNFGMSVNYTTIDGITGKRRREDDGKDKVAKALILSDKLDWIRMISIAKRFEKERRPTTKWN